MIRIIEMVKNDQRAGQKSRIEHDIEITIIIPIIVFILLTVHFNIAKFKFPQL